MPRVAVTPPPPPAAHLESVRQRLAAAPAPAPAADAPPMFVRAFRFAPAQQPGWHAVRERRLEAAGKPGVVAVTQLTLAADDDPALLARLEVYETRSHEAARELLVELLTGFEILPQRLALDEGADRAAVALPNGRVHLSVRGNLVAVLAQLDGPPRDMAEQAGALDAFLTAGPDSAPPPGGRKARARAKARQAAPADAAGEMTRYVAAAGLALQDDGTVTARDGAAAAYVYDDDGERWRQR